MKVGNKGISTMNVAIISIVVTAIVVGVVVFMAVPKGGAVAGEVTESDVKSFLDSASSDVVKGILSDSVSPDIINESATGPRPCTIAAMVPTPFEGESWNATYVTALDWMEQQYPNVTTIKAANVAKEDTNTVAISMIEEQGADIIFGDYEDCALEYLKINEQYPDVYFSGLIVGDITTRSNFIRIFPKEDQAIYLTGMVAGAITETNNLGIVGSMLAPQMRRRTSYFALGARAVNPDVNVYVIWTGSWFDPPTDTEVANTLINTYNCDVLTQQTDTTAGAKVAEEKGVWFVGKDSDFVETGWASADTIATSFKIQWQFMMDSMYKDWMAGDKTPRNMYFVGYDEALYTPEGPLYNSDISFNGKPGIPDGINPKALALMDQATINLMIERRNSMIAGIWDPFMEEIKDTEGNVRSPKGQMPTEDEFLLMDYFVEGMIVP